jgi:uncharacterized protein YhaN
VFAIGLREIQELGALDDTDAAQWLYKLASGGDRVSLVDVLAELAKARQRLIAGGQGTASIPDLLAERDKLRRLARDQEAVRRYVELARKGRELAERIAACEFQAAGIEKEARLVEVAAAIHEKWHALNSLKKELAVARAVPRIDPQVLAEFKALSTTIERGRVAQKRLARRLAKRRRAIDALAIDKAVHRRGPRIEALLDEEQWITALDLERNALAEKIKGVERERAELCVRHGLDPAATAVDSTEASGKAWRQLKPLGRELTAARRRLAEVTKECEERGEGSAAAAKELAAALAARGAQSLTPLLERSGALVSLLRRRVQLDDRVAELSRRKTELEAKSRDLAAHALLPGWAVVALGVIFVAGVVAGLAGLFLPASWIGGMKLALAVLGLLAAGAAAATKLLLERAFDRRSATCLAQLETLAGQLEEATQERDSLDQELPSGGGPLLARLQAAEKEQAAVEALVPLEARRQSATAEAAAAESRREEAHQEYAALRHRWRHALADVGLSPNTPPGRARRIARAARSLAELDARLAVQRAELVRREGVVAAFQNRLRQLRAELAVPPAGDGASSAAAGVSQAPAAAPVTPAAGTSLVDDLRSLRERLREQRELAARRRSILHAARRLRDRRHKVRGRVRRCERRLAALFDRAGLVDAAELHHRIEQADHGDQLAQKSDTLATEISALVGPRYDEARLAELVAGNTRAQLDERWLELTGRASKLREETKTAHEQLGRWRQESETLAADRERGQAGLRLGVVERLLRESVERWRVLAATEWLLAGVRKRYERERQPETLREASGYLAQLTEGRYTRVWTPLEEDVLRVDDAQGESLAPEVLSRGTREQLFLSLRLALVTRYARRGVDLPLVLDDVLVNFDARRARSAAIVLRDFAARHEQVLVFTCHQHIYELFRSLGVAVRELPANPRAGLGRAPVAEMDVPHEPAAPPVDPAAPRPQLVEVVEPHPRSTNGHRPESDVAADDEHESVDEIEPASPAPARRVAPARDRRGAHVKFDSIHGPRGPFATALWHERVTYELSAEPDEDDGDSREWTDVEDDRG